MTKPTTYDATEIVHQMQILTDIEGDLADTAMAVAAADVSKDPGSDGTMMQNAEAMESTLEQSIPAHPPSDTATKETSTDPQANGEFNTASSEVAAAVPHDTIINGDVIPAPPEPSAAAHDVSTALTAVEADLNNPVMPESVVSPAHDVETETAVEESAGNIIVEVEQPNVENIAQAAANGEIVPQALPANPETPPEGAAPVSLNGVEVSVPPSQQPTPPKMPAQTPYASIQSPKGEFTLPEGLTEASPSVRALPDLIRSSRSGGLLPLGCDDTL